MVKKLKLTPPTPEQSVFRDFSVKMGFNAKQIAEAGNAIGLSAPVSYAISQGRREVSETERLAMSAVLAGLAPYDGGNEDEIIAVRQLSDIVKKIASGKHIPDLASSQE